MTNRGADDDPCTGEGADMMFEPGEHFSTAGLVVPGSEQTAATRVELVDGDRFG